MPVWVNDYVADTRLLSVEEHGLYWLLLLIFWQSQCRLRFDRDRLARALGVSTPEFDRIWEAVEPYWHVDEDGWLHNKRAEHEWRYVNEKVDKARAASQRGHKARWGTSNADRNADGNADGMPTAMRTACDPQCERHADRNANGNADRMPLTLTPTCISPDGDIPARAREKPARKRISKKRASPADRVRQTTGELTDGK